MGASLSTEERMTAEEWTDWVRATDQMRAIIDKALHRIFVAPMYLTVYVLNLYSIIPCNTITTMTVLPLFFLAGAFMVMRFSQDFFSLKEIGEWMARERVRRARNNGVEKEESPSFPRFTWPHLMKLLAFLVLGFVHLFIISKCVKHCP